MRLLTLTLCWLASFSLVAAETSTNDHVTVRTLTNAIPLVPGPNDANISKVVATILEKGHYLRQDFNDEISSRFLDRYLDSLDNLHLYFNQSDLKEFETYRDSLDNLILRENDTSPARVIFKRFRERIQQQYDYVNDLLKTEKFTFESDDKFLLNRKTLPRPNDIAEAKKLWRDRLRYEYLQEKLNKEKPEEIVKIISRRYTRILRAIMEYDNDDVLEIFLTALAHVYDPHSDYMGKSSLENFSIGMKLSLFGIGALLRSEDGYCKIQELKPGPAQRSKKLKPNDRIVAVAQGNEAPVDVVDMKLNKVVELIRGPKGTEVRLTVIPADASDPSARSVVTLVREEIKLEDQEAKAKLFEGDINGKKGRWGVIDLPSFYAAFELEGNKSDGDPKSTTTDVSKLIKKLLEAKVEGLILDLRHNGGGSLEEAINLTGLFIPEGPVVQVRDADGRVIVDKDRDPTMLYKGPLIVLTSRFSASASEILAGALQDYGRAVIVGDSSTHGKGTVQSLIQLSPYMRQFGLASSQNPGALKVTIRKFYRASGASTQLKGVTPDIILPSVNNFAEVGESSLENPLPWDTIAATNYMKLNMVENYVDELRKRSEKRTSTEKDYLFIKDEIERFKKIIAEKSVSMNEAVRIKEKQEADDRSKARKKELANRPAPKETMWDITLKTAENQGLPEPTPYTNFVKRADAGTGKFRKIDDAKNTKSANGKSNPKVAVPSEDHPTDLAETKPKTGEDDEDEADKTPAIDAAMDEATRILTDYIRLFPKPAALAESASSRK
ncbi:MAG TPA: carboxy terminal-processing peptidase [Candidatus Saccharimonadales bacterium]|nr:carboxy terminal-processing peptidase [Candidatus Saccharimonadales bacterium]